LPIPQRSMRAHKDQRSLINQWDSDHIEIEAEVDPKTGTVTQKQNKKKRQYCIQASQGGRGRNIHNKPFVRTNVFVDGLRLKGKKKQFPIQP
jgi:hypothetical protein